MRPLSASRGDGGLLASGGVQSSVRQGLWVTSSVCQRRRRAGGLRWGSGKWLLFVLEALRTAAPPMTMCCVDGIGFWGIYSTSLATCSLCFASIFRVQVKLANVAPEDATSARCHAGGADNTVRLWNLREASGAGEAAGKGPATGAGAAAPAAAALPGLLKTYPTKATPVFALNFTQRNLLLGTGTLTLTRRNR